jgi:SagB-type dehydrogenase family enzyme
MGIGSDFHKQTYLTLQGLRGLERPSPTLAPDEPLKIRLPAPEPQTGTLGQVVHSRRSVRDFASRPLALSQVSELLHTACGVTARASGHGLRAAPSAGALYPLDTYLVVNRVKDLEPGIYLYDPEPHALELRAQGGFSGDLVLACLGQEFLFEAGVVFVMAAVFERTCHKYGDRGYRYVYMEAGHISQNLYLQATSLGLGTVAIGAFFDHPVNALIGLDGIKEAAVYLQAVGTLESPGP